MTTPAPPPKEELAYPDRTGIFASTSTFVELLAPTDTVLRQKGGNYSVYREVLRDDQCKSTFQQRRDKVIAAEWKVEPGGTRAIDKKAADFMREQLLALEWDRATNGMLYGLWYGYSVAELLYDTDGRYITIADIKVRDRSRFRWGIDNSLWLRRDTGDELMPERKFWTFTTGADHDDEPYGLGLAHYCYWPVFFKRNDIKFWLVFLEKWAAPTVKGKVSQATFNDPVARAEALRQLRSFATDTAIVVPDNIEVELMEAARGGSSSYEEMRASMDAAIAKIVLSQTMTTDNGSSRSQSEVHERVADDVVKSDADMVCGSFNRGAARWLTEWNFPGAAVPRVWRDTAPPADLGAIAERDTKIISLGYEPTEEYVKATYGDGWRKKAVQQGLPPDQLEQIPQQLAAEFADLPALALLKSSKKLDQAEIAQAAQQISARYQGIIGERVSQLLAFAENTGDYETMRRHLLEMTAQPAPAQASTTLANVGILARLLGIFRAQR